MTEQEIFDKVALALLKQGRKSANVETGECRYRTVLDDGSVIKCAVGHLISEHEYSPKFEGRGAKSTAIRSALIRTHNIVDETTLNMLTSLQVAHDGYHEKDNDMSFNEHIRLAFGNVAIANGLDTKILEEV